MQKVLIADGTEELCIALAEHLQSRFQVITCREGNEALELIFSYRPDVLVLDLMLPGLDGISLLREAEAAGQLPIVLAITRFVNDYVIETLTQMGVGYIMRKPCDTMAAVERVTDLSSRTWGERPSGYHRNSDAASMLRELGIPEKRKGYRYLLEAVTLMAEDPMQAVTKELYPAVGKRCGVNKEQVERSIRGAIQTAWEKMDKSKWERYFPGDSTGKIQRPTNGEFISCLADRIRTGDHTPQTKK